MTFYYKALAGRGRGRGAAGNIISIWVGAVARFGLVKSTSVGVVCLTDHILGIGPDISYGIAIDISYLGVIHSGIFLATLKEQGNEVSLPFDACGND